MRDDPILGGGNGICHWPTIWPQLNFSFLLLTESMWEINGKWSCLCAPQVDTLRWCWVATELRSCYAKVLSEDTYAYHRGALKICPTQMQMVFFSNCAGCNLSTVNGGPVPGITSTPLHTLPDLFLSVILQIRFLDFIVYIRDLYPRSLNNVPK